jgi:flavin-binding protein dodecin
MSIAKVTEITSTSTKSFDDAVSDGVARANKSLKNVTSAWVADQKVTVENGKITGYQVRMKITFILQ